MLLTRAQCIENSNAVLVFKFFIFTHKWAKLSKFKDLTDGIHEAADDLIASNPAPLSLPFSISLANTWIRIKISSNSYFPGTNNI